MNDAGKMTVFYTDDDVEDIEFFKEVVATLPKIPSLVTHGNGQDLLDALDNPPPTPNMLFLDLNMPGINGFDVLTHLRTTGLHKKLPIVIFSTSKDEFIIQKSLELGANFFVPKSSSFPALKSSIEFTLNIDWNSFLPTKENFVYAKI